LREGRGDATEKVEQQELQVSKAVFDVVTKDPQVKHVAKQVDPTSMHEHRREYRREFSRRICEQSSGNHGPLLNERLTSIHLNKKEKNV
jgi:hypothetical protein